MKQIAIFLMTGLFCLWLLGCGGDTAVSTPTSFAQLPTETATHTPSPRPTNTATSVPTASPATSPTITSTPSATPTPDHVDFPAWVLDPDTNVLLLSATNLENRNDYNGPYLLNIQTGEEFSVPIQGGNISWVQDEVGVQLKFSYREERSMLAYEMIRPVVTVDLGTGLVSYDEIVRNTLEERNTNIKTYPSPDGRYIINVLEVENPPSQVFLVNAATGAEIELLDPFEHSFPDKLDVNWSPTSERIAVERIRLIEDETASYGLRAESAFAVYDLSGAVLTQHQDIQHHNSSWAPQSSSLLLFPSPYSSEDQVSCILDIDSELYTCLNKITDWRNKNDVEINALRWSPDGDKISFVYWDAQGGGFCYIEFSGEQIICPATWNDLQIEAYLQLFDTGDGAHVFVTNYVWSPDGQYIALYINPGSPLSDDRTLETLSVTNVTGDWLKFVGTSFPLFVDPWRPSLNAPMD